MPQSGVWRQQSYLFSGLVRRSEINTLLDRLYGSSAERLHAMYKMRTKIRTSRPVEAAMDDHHLFGE
jgi:hypothetical protein